MKGEVECGIHCLVVRAVSKRAVSKRAVSKRSMLSRPDSDAIAQA